MNGRPWIAVAAVLVAGGAVAWIAMSDLGENLVYYWSPSEMIAAGTKAEGATIRLGGQVEAGSVVWSPDTNHLSFVVTDGLQRVAVASTGAPPQMFREGIGVVVEGSVEGGTFRTDRVMVKHSNEYRAPEDGAKPDLATLTEGGP